MPLSPERWSVREAAEALARRSVSAAELTQACLARIAQREPLVHAWACLDAEFALRQARACDVQERRSPIHGIPFGIKDIIDTADLPTSYGSPIYRGHRPARNAACVERLLDAGAIVLGKTVTTEFANRTPGPTANPRNPEHTPGGSSSGSAAAVADLMVPASLGTQTTGSVIRPAAYCGIVGYKPSYATFDVAGIKPCAPSLDTLGLMVRDVADIPLIAPVLADRPWRPSPTWNDGSAPRLAVCRTPVWEHATEATRRALDTVVASLARLGVPVEPDRTAVGQFDGLREAQRMIMAVETARSLHTEYMEHRDSLSPSLCELIEHGRGQSPAAYAAAISRVQQARSHATAIFGDFDALLTPSAPGEAPHGLGSTGDPIFCAIWTALHVPCVTLPAITGDSGLPVGIQLVGRAGQDESLLGVAEWLTHRLDPGITRE